MGQVPTRQAGKTVPHLLIGNGRVAKHFSRYLSLAEISFEHWDRPRIFDEELASMVARSERVWLLVSDSAIAETAKRLPSTDARVLHASGATVVAGVQGAHPLMTFGTEFYDLATYRRIPFVIEDFGDGASSSEVLGELGNPAMFLAAEKRPLYHALVSISGNFPAMLWADVFERFERDLGLSRDLLVPFLFRTLLNVIEKGEHALTGPLIRGDHDTIRKHHEAIEGTALASVYRAFEAFLSNQEEPRHERPLIQ